MSIITNEQSVFLMGLGVIGGGVLWYASRKAGAVVERVIDDGLEQVGAAVHAPFQITRDIKADGATVGTQAWFENQMSDLQEWAGLNPAIHPTYTPYDGVLDPTKTLPAF